MKTLVKVLGVVLTFASHAYASPQDLWQGFEQLQSELMINMPNNKPSCVNEEEIELKVFISTSMPLQSIRRYFQDSAKYKAVLVLKGLPNGSFIDLRNFVQGLTDKGVGNLVLDEEAFERFKIEIVPIIVLSNGSKEDRITGNVDLKYALEQFAARGNLARVAKEILQGKINED